MPFLFVVPPLPGAKRHTSSELDAIVVIRSCLEQHWQWWDPLRHVVDPTWWTSCTVHERNPKSPLFWVWPLTFVHTTLITTETLKLGLSRQEETWHSPCLKRNKEMKHDHDSNPFIVWMFVLIVVERYPFVVVSKYGNCSYSIDFGWHKQVIHIFLPFLPHHWTLQILHL